MRFLHLPHSVIFQPIRLSLSTESTSYLVVFFSHNKSANSTFYHGFREGKNILTLTKHIQEIIKNHNA